MSRKNCVEFTDDGKVIEYDYFGEKTVYKVNRYLDELEFDVKDNKSTSKVEISMNEIYIYGYKKVILTEKLQEEFDNNLDTEFNNRIRKLVKMSNEKSEMKRIKNERITSIEQALFIIYYYKERMDIFDQENIKYVIKARDYILENADKNSDLYKEQLLEKLNDLRRNNLSKVVKIIVSFLPIIALLATAFFYTIIMVIVFLPMMALIYSYIKFISSFTDSLNLDDSIKMIKQTKQELERFDERTMSLEKAPEKDSSELLDDYIKQIAEKEKLISQGETQLLALMDYPYHPYRLDNPDSYYKKINNIIEEAKKEKDKQETFEMTNNIRDLIIINSRLTKEERIKLLDDLLGYITEYNDDSIESKDEDILFNFKEGLKNIQLELLEKSNNKNNNSNNTLESMNIKKNERQLEIDYFIDIYNSRLASGIVDGVLRKQPQPAEIIKEQNKNAFIKVKNIRNLIINSNSLTVDKKIYLMNKLVSIVIYYCSHKDKCPGTIMDEYIMTDLDVSLKELLLEIMNKPVINEQMTSEKVNLNDETEEVDEEAVSLLTRKPSNNLVSLSR